MTFRNMAACIFLTHLFVCVSAITTLAVLPGDGLPGVWDKHKHVAAFAYLLPALVAAFPLWSWPRYLLLGLGYAVGIEVIQWFLPYRDASLADILADVVGLAVGVLPALLVRRRLHSRMPPADSQSPPV